MYSNKSPASDKKTKDITENNFFNKSTFLFNEFARFIVDTYNIIKIDNTLHIYNDGYYTNNADYIERAMIQHISLLNKSKRKETLEYMKLIAEEKQEALPNLIAVKNGILDLFTGELKASNKDTIIRNKIDIEYKECSSPLIDKVFNRIACNDNEVVELLFEMFGYCLYRKNSFQKAFVLKGEGSNGKSTILTLLNNFLGSNNTSNVTLKDLTEGKFKLAEIQGKLANIDDDASSKYIEDSSLFKKLVSGEKISAERKGQDPFEFSSYATLVISFNSVARINDTSYGLNRRLIVLPMNATINQKDTDYIPNIDILLNKKEHLEYLLYRSVQAMSNVNKNNDFTIPAIVSEAIEQFKYDNNPILQFLEEIPSKDKYNSQELFNDYTSWCYRNNSKPVNANNFGKELKRLGYDRERLTSNGGRFYYYIKVLDAPITEESTDFEQEELPF